MTKEEFKKWYCYKSGITQDFFDKHLIVLSCNCDANSCDGWAAVGNSKLEIKIHNELYNN